MSNAAPTAPAPVRYALTGDGEIVQNFVGYQDIKERILHRQIVASSDIPDERPGEFKAFRAAIAYTQPTPKKMMWVLLVVVGTTWKVIKPIAETGKVKCIEDVVDNFVNELEVQFQKMTGKAPGFRHTLNLDEFDEKVSLTPGINDNSPGSIKLPRRKELEAAAPVASTPSSKKQTPAPEPVKQEPVKETPPAVQVRGDGKGNVEFVMTGPTVRASRWLRTTGNVLLNIETGARIYIGEDNQVWFVLNGDVEVLAGTKNYKEADTLLCQIAASLVAPSLDMQFEL